MTTREELEKLNDEQLKKVAGGTIDQTAGDSQILNDYGIVSDRHGDFRMGFTWIKKYKTKGG